MKKQDYKVSISETHHLEKLDSPSGTAITISNEIKKIKKDIKIPITSLREADEIGTHEVKYISEIDSISLHHKANKRDGFALGALIAAEWIINKKGIFTFADVLKNI